MGRQTIGATYGRLTIVAYAGKSHWRCLCACGNETTVMASNLRAGKVKSCGCYRDEVSRTHGLSNHPMYKRWHAMLERCSNPKNTNFKLYGGRGIRVCARWRDFANFYADVGDPPTGLSLDRIDVNKGYEPGNVRWATWSTQAKNKRSRKAVVIESLSIGELETILAAKRQAELGVFG